MSRISVIIVSWNAVRHLRNCLQSIRDHGDGMVREVIVVDNCSSDGSPEMVAAEFPEVILVHSSSNLGFAKANNMGIARARGEHMALVNSDVLLHPGCFRELVKHMDRDPEVGLLGPRVLGGDGKLQRSCRKLPTVWNVLCQSLLLHRAFPGRPFFSGREMHYWNHDTESEVQILSGCFWLARRDAVNQVGGLDERFFFYGEDADWCKRFRDAGWKVMLQPAATATHFGGASSANAPLRYSIEQHRANLAYWRKHHGMAGLLYYYFATFLHHSLRFLIRAFALLIARRGDADTLHKFKRSWVCLRWLVSGVRP
jgi:GT2 family glycosyltransferase